jgi:uncharacterized protein
MPRAAALLAAVAALAAAAPAAASRCGPAPAAAGAAHIAIPRLSGRVADGAHVLAPAAREALTRRLAALEARTRDQLVVVTLPSLAGHPIESWGLALGNGWGIGRKGLDNGVLLIVAPRDHKVRIEVGCGLEGLLTDARAGQIIERDIVPRFRARQLEGGIEAGVASIDTLLRRDRRRPQRRPTSAKG